MEEIKKYLNDSIVSKLNDKGLDNETIQNHIIEIINERKQIGFSGEQLELSVKQRIKALFIPILRKNTKQMKAVIFSLGNVEDENKKLRTMSKLKEGNSGYNPDTSYIVKEGFVPWGNLQGEPISENPSYNCRGLVGIENDGKLIIKEANFSGDYLNTDKHIAKSGDVVFIDLDPTKLDNKTIYINNYTYKDTLQEDKYKSLLETYLKDYFKTIEQIDNENHKGFVIVKGSVSEIEGGQYGFRFDIVDDGDSWDIDKSLIGSMKEVNFIDGASDIIFIGEVYKKSGNQPGYGFNIQTTIVPEQFKKKELPKENFNSIEEEFNGIEEQEIDEDLL